MRRVILATAMALVVILFLMGAGPIHGTTGYDGYGYGYGYEKSDYLVLNY